MIYELKMIVQRPGSSSVEVNSRDDLDPLYQLSPFEKRIFNGLDPFLYCMYIALLVFYIVEELKY